MTSGENSRPSRVLVVDDSAFMRTALTRMIESDPSLKVIATAGDGAEALEKIKAMQPDLVTLDVEMPRLNGLETLKRIMSEFPRPVIMISSVTQEGAEITFEALGHGAFDYIPKQMSKVSLDIINIRDDLVAKLKAAAVAGQRKSVRRASSFSVTTASPQRSSALVPSIVSIGTSTGGPRALQEILPLLPPDLKAGVLVVQHMPVGFIGPFARRLNNLCKIAVQEAQNGSVIADGVVYIAPAGLHMTVDRKAGPLPRIRLSPHPLGTLHTPSVDVTMVSVAEAYGALAMGIILTGMGSDGAQGMKSIHSAGGITVGQDEATSIVYGMPRACAELGILQRVVPLQRVPEQILMATDYYKRRA
jgi:two-component system, chemotaxis family, protein-glutamate methylesterase/glutaminase